MSRVGLSARAVALVVVVALTPLVAAAVLIDQMAEVAQSFAANQAARVGPALAGAQRGYRELIAAKKLHYREQARHAALDAGDPARLAALFAAEPELIAIELVAAGAPVRRLTRPDGVTPPTDRPIHRVEAAAQGGTRATLEIAIDPTLARDYEELGRLAAEVRQVDSMNAALPRGYKLAFLGFLGAVVVVAGLSASLLARRVTRRIDRLVAGTRAVADGDLATRVALPGRDEVAELGAAFDRMVADLERDRGQILYLQRMAAWQDVARRLAHEIKNPLTPIQLAVQQLVSSYAGDDDRHRRLLAEVAEIVGEEIAGLRRLVDAFRELGRLPEVDAQPLDLATVVDDLAREAALGDRLEVRAPAAAVVVHGDRLLLRRVLANLVENGIHAGQEGGAPGRVRVSWTSDAATGQAWVAVDDQGAGVAATARERIFEPYVTTKATGTGLGLPIAKKIALEHHGDLEVAEAAAPELGGARFVLRLPLAERSPVPGGPAAAP